AATRGATVRRVAVEEPATGDTRNLHLEDRTRVDGSRRRTPRVVIIGPLIRVSEHVVEPPAVGFESPNGMGTSFRIVAIPGDAFEMNVREAIQSGVNLDVATIERGAGPSASGVFP